MEIAREELKIGNFVRDKTLGVCRVTGIHRDTGAWVQSKFENEPKGIEVEELEAVELNTEWLLAFGLTLEKTKYDYNGSSLLNMQVNFYEEIWILNIEDEEDGDYEHGLKVVRFIYPNKRDSTKYAFYIRRSGYGDRDFGYDDGDFQRQFSYSSLYVHELQNVFYQAFGLELEIKNSQFIN